VISNASFRLFYADDNGFSNDRRARRDLTVALEAHMTIRQLVLLLCSLALPLTALAQSQGGGTMQKYVIERDLPGAGKLSPSELQAISRKSREVLAGMGTKIQWVQSYVTDDKIYCVYLAENETDIRSHAKAGGFPVNRISRIMTMIDPTTAQ
jgi:Nickel responsive protein SCO4226-like